MSRYFPAVPEEKLQAERQAQAEIDRNAPSIVIHPPRQKGDVEVIDEYAPLSGKIKPLNRPSASAKERKTEEQQEFARYAQLLVKHEGNAVAALAIIHNCTEEEAAANIIPWRDEIHRKGKGTSLMQMLSKHEVDTENQIAVLADHMYSQSPAASLKSIELLQNMTGKAKSRREGMSAEDAIRLALSTVDAAD